MEQLSTKKAHGASSGDCPSYSLVYLFPNGLKLGDPVWSAYIILPLGFLRDTVACRIIGKQPGGSHVKTRYTTGLALLAGIAVGAAAVQGLYAQAKPKAYLISETEALDAAAVAAYGPLIRPTIDAAGGRRLNTPGGKTVAFVGDPPKRIAITEWDSLEKAQAFVNSDAFKKLAPPRDK